MNEPTEAEIDLCEAISAPFDNWIDNAIPALRSYVAAEVARAQKDDRKAVKQLNEALELANRINERHRFHIEAMQRHCDETGVNYFQNDREAIQQLREFAQAIADRSYGRNCPPWTQAEEVLSSTAHYASAASPKEEGK